MSVTYDKSTEKSDGNDIDAMHEKYGNRFHSQDIVLN